jgi:SAM-dependent methyltransferase
MNAADQPIRTTRPVLYLADIIRAPIHDFPIRDEILFQFLPLTAGLDALEVGPGSGFTAFRLAPHLRHLTVLDVAPLAVSELERTLGGYRNIRFVCADVCEPGLAEILGRTYDVVFGLDMFEYAQEPALCLRNLASALRPGGELFLTFPNVPPPIGDGVTYFNDQQTLEGLLRDAGFASWSIFAVRPRRFAAAVYSLLHEWPLRLYRRARTTSASKARPQVYEATWAFEHRQQLMRFKAGLHFYWLALERALRLGGAIFRAEPVAGQPLGRQLVIRAMR